jgi:hypothetical protein
MTVADFDALAAGPKTIAFTKKERANRQGKSSSWDNIRTDLVKYHGLPKEQLLQRWKLLMNIIHSCNSYLTGKRHAGEIKGKRAAGVELLKNQATVRMDQEQEKAMIYGNRVNQAPPAQQPGRKSPGVVVGGQGKSHGENRFERALVGGKKDPKHVLHGKLMYQSLGTFSTDSRFSNKPDIELTQNDNIDAYALRLWVKRRERGGAMEGGKGLGQWVIPYFGNTERDAHALDFQPNQVCFKNGTLNTKGIRVGAGTHEAMYAVSQEGTFYVRTDLKKKFHHSCFLAGQSVMCAGMIAALNGRLIHISNDSGHYGPSIPELLDACRVIVESGYDYGHDLCVLYTDFQNLLGGGAGKIYRIPFDPFVQSQGLVPNRDDFVVLPPQSPKFYFRYADEKRAQARGASIPLDFLTN